MVDWMVEVTHAFKFSERAFFLSVALMDYHCEFSKAPVPEGDLHLIGVTTMFLSSKYEDILPLSLNTVFKKIGHGSLSKETIKACEKDIFVGLKWNLNLVLAYDFLVLLVENMKINNESEKNIKQRIREKALFLLKMAVHE